MRSSIESMCCLLAQKAQIVIVTSALGRCLLDKRTVGLKAGKFSVYKCLYFRVIFYCRGPQTGLMKLEGG